MNILSVRYFHKAIFAGAAALSLAAIALTQPSLAQEIRANGFGFVDNKYRKAEFLPAAVFRTSEGATYLITNRLVSPKYHQLCFIEGSKLTIIPSGEWLNEPTSFAGIFGPDICSYYVPYEEIDDDARSMLDKMAVNESDFVPPQVGLPVKIRGQTVSLYTAGEDADGVIAASGHAVYGGRFAAREQDSRTIHYNLILPASPGCPPISWVQLDQQQGHGQSPFVGLVINHLPYKKGDCFLDIEDLKLICSEDLIGAMVQRAMNPPISSGTGKSGLIYDLDVSNRDFADDWRPTGETPRSFFRNIFASDDTPNRKDLGIASSLVQFDELLYLLIDATHAARLKSDSKLAFRIAGEISDITIGDHFSWSPEYHIAINDTLVALPSRKDIILPESIQQAAHRLDAAIDAEEGLEAIYGMSHTDGILRRRVEESLVYYLDIAFTQEDYGLKPVPSFNAGVYPTALFGVKDNRPRFFGILGFNKQTQEPTIYSAAELRAFLSAK